MFALFTSHAQLKRTAAAVRDAIGGRWPLMVQGEGQRDRLLRRFRDSGSAILLGTDSFWGGGGRAGTAASRIVAAQAAVQGSGRAAHRRPPGADRGERRGRI